MSEMPEETTQFPSVQLLAEYVKGDEEAAKQIFDKYVFALISIARARISPVLQSRIDPDDIVQSACGAFFYNAREKGLVLQRSGELWRLLATYTLNKTRKYIEKELAAKRDPRLERGDAFWHAAIEREPSPEEANMLVEELSNFMNQLTPRDQRILELRLRGESVEEITSELANPSSDCQLPPQEVAQATVRRVLRECKSQFERKLLEE
jgi:hypothetical protein